MKLHKTSTYIKRIQEALSIDLLHPKYKKLVNPLDHPTTGHCFVATKAAYFIWRFFKSFELLILHSFLPILK